MKNLRYPTHSRCDHRNTTSHRFQNDGASALGNQTGNCDDVTHLVDVHRVGYPAQAQHRQHRQPARQPRFVIRTPAPSKKEPPGPRARSTMQIAPRVNEDVETLPWDESADVRHDDLVASDSVPVSQFIPLNPRRGSEVLRVD